MCQISKDNLRKILKKRFSALVGKSCGRLEIISDMKDVNFKSQVLLFKDLIKSLDYEAMRDIEESIISFSNGTKIQVKLTEPDA